MTPAIPPCVRDRWVRRMCEGGECQGGGWCFSGGGRRIGGGGGQVVRLGLLGIGKGMGDGDGDGLGLPPLLIFGNEGEGEFSGLGEANPAVSSVFSKP